MKAVFALLLYASLAHSYKLEANPIRRIVTLLQNMQKEIEAEAEKEEDLYKKFECFCKGNTENMTAEAETAATKIEQLKSRIESETGEKSRVDEELKEHKSDREEAKAAMQKASAIRDKERGAYEKDAGESKSNIEALGNAVVALNKGMGLSFLQNHGVALLSQLRKLALISRSVDEYEKQNLLSFLDSESSNSAPGGTYVPASGEIVGILKQMKEDMMKDLGEIQTDEDASQKSFEQLVSAKKAEVQAATGAIEAKTKRSGELAVSIVQAKADLKDTTASLSENQRFLANLSVQCKEKSSEWDKRQQTRSEESAAISEAIGVLNDDDALDMFKKTLPSPAKRHLGFLQSKTSRGSRQTRARAIVDSVSNTFKGTSLALLSFMLKGKKVDFTKVIVMIENMLKHLESEQKDDENHRNFCNQEFDRNDDKKKETQNHIEGLSVDIESMKGSVEQLGSEIATLQDQIKDLDKAVADASEQRKGENAEYVQSQAELNSAVQLIEKAKNKLHKFYNPNLYKASKKRELTEEERIFKNAGGEVDDSAPEQMIYGTSQSVNFLQIISRQPKTPETWGEYEKKGGKSSSVIALLDMLKKELETDVQEGQHNEEVAQKEYQELMTDSQDSRQKTASSIVSKEGSKADLEGRIATANNDLHAGQQELSSINDNVAQLHISCDFLLENFDFRKNARATESDALRNAKAALRGAK